MEKPSPQEAKSSGKSSREARPEFSPMGSGRGTWARLPQQPEPPKFYSRSYLKRYNHSAKVRSSRVPGKKCPDEQANDPPAVGQKYGSQANNPVELPIPSEAPVTSVSCAPLASQAVGAAVDISKKESPCGRGGTGAPRQSREQDYRYSLASAMSSIKTSYFKTDAAPYFDESQFNEARLLVAAEDEQFCESFRKIKTIVDEAVKKHRVFLIRGELPRLKEVLEERGWVQKYEPSRTRSLPYDSTTTLESRSLGDLRLPDGSPNERALVFGLLRHVQPDFIWDCRNDFIEWDRNIAGNVLLNRFQKPGLYTSKLGMAHILQEAHWLHETDVADVLFPRSYNPSRELAALSRDFRRCAAVALLRWFVERVRNDIEEEASEESPISLDRVEFAVKCCEEQIAELEHEDIDENGPTREEEDGAEEEEEKWRLFVEDCERLLYKPDGLANLPRAEQLERLEVCYQAAQSALEKLKKLDPQFDLNGERNIWIVKPSNLCCGSGIFMTHELKTILRKVESKPRDYYVVQKYIERPFLVYGTKFDIRQWFLVTSTFPMTIWMYKEALLRFSSKPYSYTSYHEAVHLCNTAVQERYDYERRRRRHRSGGSVEDEPTVRDLGWDCNKLDEYLKTACDNEEGGSPYWDKIYPKMSQAIVLTMLAAQDFMDRRRCSFELYGADFMVMEDLSVWLIEINTNPRMHPPSSRITQRLYAGVLDGLVKVVMDYPINPNADTGGFELAYHQSIPESQPYLGPCLFAFGKSMTLHEASAAMRKKCGASNQWSAKPYRAWTAPPTSREPKTADFVSCLNVTSTTKFGSSQDESGRDSR
ncbi:tubulin glycylase 3A-like [Copidosoma floridanum]|uniref:tubulin glycylase 3A-like n=1 Tax=Copidosoma floridanum TaxID=29053 RepID=UPI0006C96FFA|nr:tubulin glycylase 3A-like [Copidosoma floridanum]